MNLAALLAQNSIFGFTESNEAAWRLRRDERRIVLYKLDLDSLEVVEVYRIHPVDAVLLALLHGHPFDDVVARAARLFQRTVEDMRAWYESAITKWMHPGAIEVKNPGAEVIPLDPAQYAMPAGNVDLQRWWLYRPLELTIKVTDSCQRQCHYCSVQRHKDRPTPTTETWLRLVAEALDHDVISVSLVGGDPLLHHGLHEIIRSVTSRGVQPFISTKVFVSRANAEALRAAGLNQIQISIDSDVDAIEDFLVGSAGAGQQLLASIENCITAGMRVRTNSVITPYNVLLFPQLVRRLHDLGVSKMGTSQCGFSLFVDNIEEFFLREAEGKWLEQEIQRVRAMGIDARFSYTTAQARRENFAGRSFCTAGAWGIIVNSDGTAVLCDDLPADETFVVGSVFETPLLDVWNSESANRFRTPTRDLFEGTACADCDAFERCTRAPRICFRDAYFAYGRAFAPPPPCPKAPPSNVRISY